MDILGDMAYNRYDNPGNTYFPDDAQAEIFKKKFAYALLREPDDHYAAARLVFGEDFARASYAVGAWFNDPIVQAECARLLEEHGEEFFLPTKAEFARQIWREATNRGTPVEERTKLLSLYGDARGFKERPTAVNVGQVTTNVTVNKVMVVKDHGGMDKWEKIAAAQQHKLTNQNVIDVSSREVAAAS